MPHDPARMPRFCTFRFTHAPEDYLDAGRVARIWQLDTTEVKRTAVVNHQRDVGMCLRQRRVLRGSTKAGHEQCGNRNGQSHQARAGKTPYATSKNI